MYLFLKKNSLALLLFSVIIGALNFNAYAETGKVHSHELFSKKNYLREQIIFKNVNNTVLFGKYEQNGNLHDGKEPIEWIILNIDKSKNSAILISKYIIDCLPFNGKSDDVAWDTSTVRNYMNTTMLNEMFSETELLCLVPTYLVNSRNLFNGAYSGEPTYDLIYLPGMDEMFYFLSNDNCSEDEKISELTKPSLKRMSYATPYARERGVRVMGEDKKYPGTGNYFLRTTGLPGKRIWFGDVYAEYFQSYVSEYGEIKPDGTGINSIDDGIRPMIQVCF